MGNIARAGGFSGMLISALTLASGLIYSRCAFLPLISANHSLTFTEYRME
jgi:hypothetical protein